MKTWQKIGLVWVAFAIIILIAKIGSNKEKEALIQTESINNSKSDEPQQVSAKVVSLTKLLADYKRNEVAADREYRGNAIIIYGVIKSISKNVMDKPYLVITKGDEFEFESVICNFNDESSLLELGSGQRVRIGGVVTGLIMGSVMMKDCAVVQ